MSKSITKTITLSRVRIEDAPSIFKLVDENRSYLGKWLPWVDSCLNVKNTRDFILKCLDSESRNESLTAVIRYFNKIVGLVSFRSFDWYKGESIIGYWVDEMYQGKGIITGSCALLIQFGFEILKLESIKIRCLEDNKKSQFIPERLGFDFEKIAYEEEVICSGRRDIVNMVYYILSSEKWSKINTGLFPQGEISPEFSTFFE